MSDASEIDAPLIDARSDERDATAVDDGGDAQQDTTTDRDNDTGVDAAPVDPPYVMGHRGGALEVPENTLAAFSHAIDNDINPEMDVRLSSDDHVMVIHDDTVDRTTDGRGPVADMTRAELQQLDAGSHFDAQYTGEKIPTLDEVFTLFTQTATPGMIASVDTKVENDTMYDGVIALLASHGLFDRVFIEVSSPEIGDELRARPQGDRVRLAAYVSEQAAFDAALAYPHFERVHCARSLSGLGGDAHAAGKLLIPGLINTEENWNQVKDDPIDGINSNAPLFILQVIGAP